MRFAPKANLVCRTNRKEEKQISNSVLAYLHHRKIFAWPINNGGVFDPIKKTFRMNKSPWFVRGVPDIMCIVELRGLGVTLYLECKTAKGKQSPAQKVFEQNIKERKGFYFVIRSVADVSQAIAQVEERAAHNWNGVTFIDVTAE